MMIDKIKKNAERADKIVEIFERKNETTKLQDKEFDQLENTADKHPEDVPRLPLLKAKEENVDQPQDLAAHPQPEVFNLNKQEACTSGDSDVDVDDVPLQIAEDTEKKVITRLPIFLFCHSNNILIIFMPIPIFTSQNDVMLSKINFQFTVRSFSEKSIFILKWVIENTQ